MQSRKANILNNKQMNIQKQLLKSRRRSKRGGIKQSFACQCGRIYLSFPALYLHVKNKHKYKLTTKLNNEICRIQKSQGFIKYTYYILEIQKSIISEFHTHKIANDIQITRQKLQNHTFGAKLEKEWLEQFKDYFLKIQEKKQRNAVQNFIHFVRQIQKDSQQSIKQQIKQIPHLYNYYMLDYIPLKNGQQIYSISWKQTCIFLQKLYQWMFQNGLTNLFVIHDIQ